MADAQHLGTSAPCAFTKKGALESSHVPWTQPYRNLNLISVRRIFLPKKKSVSAPSVSFIHQWRFPCRRGTRVNISTPFIPVHVTFEYSVTDYTGSTDKERRLFRSTRNPWTSSMNKYPSERLFCLIIVLTVDEKWFTARIKPPQVRIIPVDDDMSEDTGDLD